VSSIRGYRALRRVVNMKVLALAVLVGSLLWADLEQRVESRVRLSKGRWG